MVQYYTGDDLCPLRERSVLIQRTGFAHHAHRRGENKQRDEKPIVLPV